MPTHANAEHDQQPQHEGSMQPQIIEPSLERLMGKETSLSTQKQKVPDGTLVAASPERILGKKVPKMSQHTVQAGEGLWTIAKKYNPLTPVTEIAQLVQKIVELNKLGSVKALIAPGQILKVPSKINVNNKKQTSFKVNPKLEENIRALEQKMMGQQPDHTRVFQPPVFEGKPSSKNKDIPKTTSEKQKTTTQKNTSLDWLKYLKQGKISDKNLLAKIKANRNNIPDHSKKLSYEKTKTYAGYYYGGSSKGKPSAAKANQAKNVVWEELVKEGGYESINAYDGEIFTWGKGFAATGQLPLVLSDLLSDASIAKKFSDVGMALTNNILNLVDVNSGVIYQGNAAYQQIRVSKTLLSFFINIGQKTEDRQKLIDAQYNVIMGNAGNIPSFVYDEKKKAYKNSWNDNGVRLASHLAHWLPAGAWKYPSEYVKSKGDHLKIIQAFCLTLYKTMGGAIVYKHKNRYVFNVNYKGGLHVIPTITAIANGVGINAVKKVCTTPITFKNALDEDTYKNHILLPQGGSCYTIPVTI